MSWQAIPCYVCQSSATFTDDPVFAAKTLNCPQCGTYSISDDFFADVSADEHPWNQVKPKLSLALRWASDRAVPVTLGRGEDVMWAIGAYESVRGISRRSYP